jgi:hypothetical protein
MAVAIADDRHPVWRHELSVEPEPELRVNVFPLERLWDEGAILTLEPDVELDGDRVPLGLHFAFKAAGRGNPTQRHEEYDQETQTVPRFVEALERAAPGIQACETITDPEWTESWTDTTDDGTISRDWDGWVLDDGDLDDG